MDSENYLAMSTAMRHDFFGLLTILACWIVGLQPTMGGAQDLYEMDRDSIPSLVSRASDLFNTNRNESLKLLAEIGQRMDTTDCDTASARYYHLMSKKYSEHERNYAIAQRWVLKMLKCATQISSEKDVTVAYQTLGNINFYQGNWEDAYEYFLKAKEGFYEQKNLRGVALTASSQAVLKSRMHHYDDAINNGHEAIKLLSTTKDTYNLIIAYQNVGTFYKAQSRLDSALDEQNRGLELSIASNDTTNLAYSYGFIADILYEKEEIDRALEYGYLSNSFAKLIGDVWLLADNAKVIADCLIKLGDYDEAGSILERAIQIGDSIKATSLLPQLYDRVEDVYAAKSSFREAYVALSQWREYQDSVLGLDQVASMQKLEAKYEERIEEILAQQDLERRQREESRQRQILFLAVILACMAFFLVAMWMHAREVSEKMVDFVLLVMVLLIFRFLYLFFDPFSLTSMSSNPWARILVSVGVAIVMGQLHNIIQTAFKKQIHRSVGTTSTGI